MAELSNTDLPEGTPSPRRPWLPPWIWRALLLAASILVPWSLWLAFSLPRRTKAFHWGTAWAGFDLLLSVVLGLTAMSIWRKSHWAPTLAGAAAAMLVCDAWFDVMTSGSNGRPLAIVEAALFELPLAFVCLWLAHRTGRTLELSRPGA